MRTHPRPRARRLKKCSCAIGAFASPARPRNSVRSGVEAQSVQIPVIRASIDNRLRDMLWSEAPV